MEEEEIYHCKHYVKGRRGGRMIMRSRMNFRSTRGWR